MTNPMYQNTMILPLPLSIHYPSHRSSSSLSNHFYSTSYYHPTSRPYQHIDEPNLVNPPYCIRRSRIKRRSIGSTIVYPSYRIHPIMTTDANIGIPSPLCSVCGDISTGIHFGGNSCESCKAFFRRSVQCLRFQNYKCSNEERCPVNIVTRKVCQFCRYSKCTAIGMKPKWVLSDQEREEKYGARRKRFRDNRVADEDPDIHKYLNKEEKTLIEDIAHALYQARATYPLNFPNPSALQVDPSAEKPETPSATTDKPPSAPANLLIVPIQRLVLFARMLKDFDLFSEDDKVNLLKGSAIEIMVCSSNTLFNPKTHTFTNYLSRDQSAIVDNQVLTLDPILMKLWGEDIFNRTRSFLISMCNLHIDEVTSTLLVPVILFSPDRSNIKDLDLVKRFQEKYATLLRKYMNWRYGSERADVIYPKLLLQVINLRALGLAHGEIIQKFMASSSVNPLVQEVIIKPEMLNRRIIDRTDGSSMGSVSPPDSDLMMDFDKTPSIDTDNMFDSDEDDATKKKQRSTMDDDFDFDFDDIDESDPRTIWRKRRKYNDFPSMSSNIQTSTMNYVQTNTSSNNQMTTTTTTTAPTTMNDYQTFDKFPPTNRLLMKPYDHQVPTVFPMGQDDVMIMSATGYSIPNPLTMKDVSFLASPQSIEQLQQLYQMHSSSSNDPSTYDYQSRPSSIQNSTMSPTPGQYYDETTYEPYRQHYAQMSGDNQQQTEQQLLHLSLNNNRSEILSPPLSDHQSQSTRRSTLDDDEQRLLNAIHAHPNKRDLVLNLLRQMNQSNSSTQQQHPRSDSSPNEKRS